MDRSESYMNVKCGETDSLSPSGAEPDVLYAKVKFKTLSATRVREDRDIQKSTYSELNFRKEERSERRKSKEDEDPPISSGPSGLSATEHTAAQEQDSKVKIRIRTYRLICLFCIVTSALILTVAGLSIHVSQIRQSQITSNRNYNELNSTFQSKLSALQRVKSDFRQKFTEMETKSRSLNETKVQICEFLTSRGEQTCSEEWVTKKDRCYYASTIEADYLEAMQQCADRDSRLLQIKSSDEARFVSDRHLDGTHTYWIGKCETGNAGLSVLYKVSSGKLACSQCGSSYTCNLRRRFICEKSAPVFPDVPVKIQHLCQQPVEAT